MQRTKEQQQEEEEDLTFNYETLAPSPRLPFGVSVPIEIVAVQNQLYSGYQPECDYC